MKVARKPASRTGDGPAKRKRGASDGQARPRAGTRTRPQEPRGPRQGPQSAPTARPADRPARATSATQAKARAKARKAKAPKVVRPPLRERLLARLATVDLSPRTLLARIPFVVLVIGALAIGLGITLWLSTDSAQRSYQLGNARALNDALTQQKEALERDVLEAQSAPALADAARNLGMIPSRDTAHLVRDPAGNWVVVGQPKPAQGAPPPPLNTKLPEEKPPAPPAPPAKPAPAPKPGAEVVQRPAPVPPAAGVPAGPEVPVQVAAPVPSAPHTAAGTRPGPPPLPGPPVPQGGLVMPPLGDTLVTPPAAAPAPAVPTVAAVPAVTDVAPGVIAPPGGPQ